MSLPKFELPQKPNYIKLKTDKPLIDLFAHIASVSDNYFILESLGEQSERSRYSVVGFDPEQLVYAKGKKLTIRNSNNDVVFEDEVDNPYYALREIYPQIQIQVFYQKDLQDLVFKYGLVEQKAN